MIDGLILILVFIMMSIMIIDSYNQGRSKLEKVFIPLAYLAFFGYLFYRCDCISIKF